MESRTVLNLLRECYKVIKDPNKWCTLVNARNSEGDPTGILDGDAVQWCSYGILFKKKRELFVLGENPELIWFAERYLREACAELENLNKNGDAPISYYDYNDKYEHDKVMAMWRLAMAKAQGECNDYAGEPRSTDL